MSNNQIVTITKNGKTYKGVIASDNSEILPCEYSDITEYQFDNRMFYIAKKNNKIGLMASDGRTILNCIFDNIVGLSVTYPKYLKLKRNGLYGLYDVKREDYDWDCEANSIEILKDNITIKYPRTILWGMVKWLNGVQKIKATK